MISFRKRLISCVAVLIISLLVLVSTVLAYGDQSVGFSFEGVSGGFGGVDGSDNGVYYSLTTGSVRLDLNNRLTDVPSGYDGTTMNCLLTLYREIDWWPDNSQGDATIGYTQNGKGTVSRFSVDMDSTKYYLYVTGGEAEFTYSSSGTMHDHY